MRHYSPDEFMSEGQRHALELADVIERAEHFNMDFWTMPGSECPSCLAGHILAHVRGRVSVRGMTGDELMKFGADWLGFTEDQMRMAFIPNWVLRGPITGYSHRPDHARRAVALLRHYAHTGEVTWQPQAAVTSAPAYLPA